MDEIEQQLQEKGIEKSDEVIIKEKPRKPRSQAQKDAFEKARKKRAENLAKKKLEQDNEVRSVSPDPLVSKSNTAKNTPEHQSGELELTAPSVVEDVGESSKAPAPKKKRGRPKGSKKLKREPEPPIGTFLPPHTPPEAGDIRYQYQNPHHSQFNPWMAYQPQAPPQVHNYYYGHQQGAVNQAPEPAPAPAPPPPRQDREVVEEVVEEEDEYEDEEDYLSPPNPLKYRFA